MEIEPSSDQPSHLPSKPTLESSPAVENDLLQRSRKKYKRNRLLVDGENPDQEFLASGDAKPHYDPVFTDSSGLSSASYRDKLTEKQGMESTVLKAGKSFSKGGKHMKGLGKGNPITKRLSHEQAHISKLGLDSVLSTNSFIFNAGSSSNSPAAGASIETSLGAKDGAVNGTNLVSKSVFESGMVSDPLSKINLVNKGPSASKKKVGVLLPSVKPLPDIAIREVPMAKEVTCIKSPTHNKSNLSLSLSSIPLKPPDSVVNVEKEDTGLIGNDSGTAELMDVSIVKHDDFIRPFMPVLFWNSRGAGSSSFLSHARELITMHRPSIAIFVEPRISGVKADKMISRLRFDFSTKVDARGFSGGIWVLWNSVVGQVQVMKKSDQYITLFIDNNISSPWALTAVYASPVPTTRELFWDFLLHFNRLDGTPWLLVGDFNQILSSDEKQGGSVESNKRMLDFREVIQCRGLMDLGFSGCKFTWTNKHPLSSLIMKRLDRAFCNVLWRELYEEAILYNLPRLHGDHCPLLLRLEGILIPARSHRPFRFELAWLTHESFPEFLNSVWQVNAELGFNLDNFAVEVQRWNADTFGNIFMRKRTLIARIAGVQKALQLKPNPFLFALEKRLLVDYEQTLLQEEILWFQKSRSQWVQLGDKNTRFFHTTTIVRRRRNRIIALKRDDHSWCVNQAELKTMALNFFQKVYTAESTLVNFENLCPSSPYPLNAMQVESLMHIPDDAEIFKTLSSMSPFKAPGPDGFQATKKPGGSHTWRSILSSQQIVSKGCAKLVMNGSGTSFWYDRWLLNKPLVESSIGDVPESIRTASVKELWRNGCWDVVAMHCLPDMVKGLLNLVQLHEEELDKLYWSDSQNGEFSVSSAYNMVAGVVSETGFWSLIWKLETLPRIKFFFWVACHNRILTRESCVLRGISNDASCPRCLNAVESKLHLLRDCPYSMSIWKHWFRGVQLDHFSNLSFHDWVLFNLHRKNTFIYEDVSWPTYFSFTCWFLWKFRNKVVFEDGFVWPFNMLDIIQKHVLCFRYSNTVRPGRLLKQQVLIAWERPPLHFIKVNVDGAAIANTESIAAGGLCRNDQGDWLCGFTLKLGVGTILHAEIQAILTGLRLAWEKGFVRVIVETDSLLAVEKIHTPVLDRDPLSRLILECKQLINRQWDCKLQHVFREANRSADILANLAFSRCWGFEELVSPPGSVVQQMNDDLYGVASLRACSSNRT
ncbi:hypothetical protein REPUB_Repub02eG0269900 [Reevesia pubescens]